MKPRKLKLVAEVSGFPTSIAEVHIQNFATERELKDWTDLVCPNCLEPTNYHGSSYECQKCNQTFSWWGKLARVIKGTKTILQIPRLLKEGDVAVGKLYKMKREDFAAYCDGTKTERGVIVSDSGSAHNLFKLLVASETCGYVIIAVYNDTTEEVIALLTVSESSRIILKEIIPINLAQIKDTLMLRRDEITDKDVMEAKAFVENFIPTAKEENLKVSDYRTQWIEEHVEVGKDQEQARVLDLKEIMVKATTVSKKEKTKK
jgi:hypothetical protein